jgi:LuxR family maltose regulon positive regulatory protein
VAYRQRNGESSVVSLRFFLEEPLGSEPAQSYPELDKDLDFGGITIPQPGCIRGRRAAAFVISTHAQARTIALAKRRTPSVMLAGNLIPVTMPDAPAPTTAFDSLLATKLYIPSPRPHRVPRPRLTARLEAGVARPLTLVSAPAGFGKSTLLAEWIETAGRQVAWVSLDEGDDDPARFLGYAVTALGQLAPGLGEETLTLLRYLPGVQDATPARLEPVLTGWLNEVHARGQDLVLVLDDYHAVESPAVHAAVQFLLDRLPPCLHLVLSTRVDPPLRLSRLRARGQLCELRARDLRFNSQEAADFLNQAMGLALSTADVEALEERTEGWAVGLQMAALSLQGRRDVEGFIAQFTGSHRFVLDYLTDEVLSRQPAPVRDFLLRTAILTRLSAPLCDALLGEETGAEAGSAQAILETLDAANLFLIPLDDTRTWYRYHHLFGTLLRHQLERQEGKAGVAALHERALDWYAANGYPEDALEHALAAGALDRATELISAHALPRLMRADAGTVIRWLRSLPAAWLDRRPELRLTLAWALVARFEIQLAEEQVCAAERAFAAGADPETDGNLAILRGLLTLAAGRTGEAIELYERALERLPESADFLRGLLFLELGTAHLIADDLPAAEGFFARSRTANERAGNTFRVLVSEWHLAEIRIAQGRLHEAYDLARQSLRRAEEDGRNSPGAAMAHGVLAEIEREWNDLPAAVELAGRAWQLGKHGEIANGLLVGSFTMARVLQSLGDYPGALAALDRAEEIMNRAGAPRFAEVIHALRAGIQLDQGRSEGDGEALEAAARWAQGSGLLDGWREALAGGRFPGVHRRELAFLVVARIQLARGDTGAARALLADLLALAERSGRVHSQVEVLILESLVRKAQGDAAGALAALRGALILAEPGRFVRTFLDAGPEIDGMIRQAISASGLSPDYARRLAEAFGTEEALPEVAAPEMPPQALPEPLTEREVEVLRLIATGLSNADAGGRLFIAPSTVKKHLENIYAKLGTRNRTQAIARARGAGLL